MTTLRQLRYRTAPHFSGCENYQRVCISSKTERSSLTVNCCRELIHFMALREKYQQPRLSSDPIFPIEEFDSTKLCSELPPKINLVLKLKNGVYHAVLNDNSRKNDEKIDQNCVKNDHINGKKDEFNTKNQKNHEKSISNGKISQNNGQVKVNHDIFAVTDIDSKIYDPTAFFADLKSLKNFESNGNAKTLSYTRLKILEARFNLHVLLNENAEMEETKKVPHRDFYNVYKVDNHVHHSACMNQKQFLRFIKQKIKNEGDQFVALDKNNKPMTLQKVMDSLNITSYNLSIDSLDMHAHQQTYQRFDKFNQKYNPIGSSLLRTIFLKTSNFINGRYLAEITKNVFSYLKEQKYQYTEYRLSIYGKHKDEWKNLSRWVINFGLQSENNRWMIQIPRLYEIYKANKIVKSFQDMLDFIFKPLFEVTIDPSKDPILYKFLILMSGFDTVDDESTLESNNYSKLPSEWNGEENPPYAIYAYYLYANIRSLNELRIKRGLNTFSFRPHAGEAGSIEHLAVTFLLSDSINHGILLKKSPVLCYLYYLSQIGISISPLSNNILFLKHEKHPFPYFFKIGMNATLSTDDPLMIHYTKDPLIEEYSIAAQIWNLSKIDMSEIAVNSVYQSGFDERIKNEWLGKNHRRLKIYQGVSEKTNIPKIRLLFRKEIFEEEMSFVKGE